MHNQEVTSFTRIHICSTSNIHVPRNASTRCNTLRASYNLPRRGETSSDTTNPTPQPAKLRFRVGRVQVIQGPIVRQHPSTHPAREGRANSFRSDSWGSKECRRCTCLANPRWYKDDFHMHYIFTWLIISQSWPPAHFSVTSLANRPRRLLYLPRLSHCPKHSLLSTTPRQPTSRPRGPISVTSLAQTTSRPKSLIWLPTPVPNGAHILHCRETSPSV